MSPINRMRLLIGCPVDIRVAYNYMSIRRGCLAPFEFQALLDGIDDTHYIDECVLACKGYITTDWAPFNLMVFERALNSCMSRDDRPHELNDFGKWSHTIEVAISDGLDIHTTAWTADMNFEDGYTALHQILHDTNNTNHALDNVETWVDMLERAAVDVEQYLEVEIKLCASTWDENSTWYDTDTSWHGPETVYKRRFVVRERGGRRLPCWVEVFPDFYPMRDMFVEFPHLREKSSFGKRGLPGTFTGGHLAWKSPLWKSRYNWFDFSTLPSYPIYPPLDRGDLSYLREKARLSESEQELLATLDRACDLMESRFERKQAKKRRKAGSMKALKQKGRMPGSWIDEFDY